MSSGRARVVLPHGVHVATEWSWRLLLILTAVGLLGFILLRLSVVVVPVLIAMLLTALLLPVTDFLERRGLPRGVAAGLTLFGLILLVLGLLALVGQQVAMGYEGLARQVVRGTDQIREWLIRGPLNVTEREINEVFESLRRLASTRRVTEGALQVSTTVGHVVGGLFLALFTGYFLLYQGDMIWRFILGLFPRMARERVDAASRRGWVALTAFVRATVLVAGFDAVGITVVAVVLRVPFALPIGVVVFLASFVPIVGALVSGAVAVIVALVTEGPLIAALMLAGVLVVQQVEAHVLQPFLLGRLVRLHPVAVLLAIGAGAYLAGIIGALFAVPLTAALNGVIRQLAADGRPPEPATTRAEAADGPGRGGGGRSGHGREGRSGPRRGRFGRRRGRFGRRRGRSV